MIPSEIYKEKIKNDTYLNAFNSLYPDEKGAVKRYTALIDSFTELFGKNREISIWSAPGRTEIIGNHTDHQHGCCIAASVNLDVIGAVSLNNSNIIRIKSEGHRMDEVDISDLEVNTSEINSSRAIIRGIAASFVKRGYTISGFDAYTTSNVLKGSGLSSSAAFEILVTNIINDLFCDSAETEINLAKIGKYAENVYFGKPSGLLDQTASSVGGVVFMDFCDENDPVVEKIDFDFKETEHSLCITDTGGSHADLTHAYADITNELRGVSNFFQKEYLRDVSEEAFENKIAHMRATLSDRAIMRAFHVFSENNRVLQAKEALFENDFERFKHLVTKSGDSSYKYLQNIYSTENTAEQGLSLALLLSDKILKNEGAYRVHGGGFGGTIAAFVPNKLLYEYRRTMEAAFGKDTCFILSIRPVGGIRLEDYHG